MGQDASPLGNSFAPPPSAFPPAPRAVRLRYLPYGIILTVLLMAVVGVLLCMVSIVPQMLAASGDWLGAMVPGRITEKTMRGRSKNTYILRFTYQVDDQDCNSEMDVEEVSFEQVKVGDPVRVRVAPFLPGIGAIQEPKLSRSWNASCFVGFVVLWHSILVFIVWSVGRAAIRRRYLARHGLPTLGRISDKRVATGKGGGMFFLTYHYQVRKNPAGNPIDCTEHEATMMVTSKDFQAAQVGQLVTVLFDPANPDNSIIYRCGEYEVIGVS